MGALARFKNEPGAGLESREKQQPLMLIVCKQAMMVQTVRPRKPEKAYMNMSKWLLGIVLLAPDQCEAGLCSSYAAKVGRVLCAGSG